MNEFQQSEGSTPIKDVRHRLGGTRRSLLEALRAVGGEGNTTAVKQATDVEIPEGSTRYHFGWLRDEDLIREIDR